MIATPSPLAPMSAAVNGVRAPRLLYVTTISASLWRFMHPFARHFRDLGWTVDGMARGASDCVNCVGTFDHVWEAPWSRNPLNPKESPCRGS